jgi:hypothetical protein
LKPIKWCVKIVRGGDVGRHLLGWFDTGRGGWVCLGLGERVSAGGTWWMLENAKKDEMFVSAEFAKKVSIGTENFVLNTVGCCGVSIGESLERKRSVRAVLIWAIVPF